MDQHLLQSSLWENYQKLEGHQTFRLTNTNFDALAILMPTPLGNYLYCPYGPTLKTADDLQSALSALKDLAKQQNAFFIRIEPTLPFPVDILKSLGLKKSHDLDPAHTWVLDLTEPESQIFAEMEKEKGRLWRNYAKKGLSLRRTQDPSEITILTSLLKSVGDRNGFTPQDENHLKNQLTSGFATLYIAEYEGHPVAASLVYDYAGVRYYAHAAADTEHRKLVAGTILLVQMIVDAKAAGAHTFDFWGITTSDDPNHPWAGFTKYKKSFGGHQVDYSGTWDLPLNHARYRAYTALRSLNRAKRRHFML